MEINDRVPYPGKDNRKRLTFEDDSSVRYAKIEYADEPIQEGTPINAQLFATLQTERDSAINTKIGDHNTDAAAHSGLFSAINLATLMNALGTAVPASSDVIALQSPNGTVGTATLESVGDLLGSMYPKMATGSYTGTGQLGASYKNSLVFNFAPQIVFVFRTNIEYLASSSTGSGTFSDSFIVFLRPATTTKAYGNSSSTPTITIAWSDTGVNWYTSTNVNAKFNTSGTTYYYIALGV